MRVRLIKRFAERIDKIDLSAHEVGDTLDLERSNAQLLLAEGWAVPERRGEQRHYMSAAAERTAPAGIVADYPRRNRRRFDN